MFVSRRTKKRLLFFALIALIGGFLYTNLEEGEITVLKNDIFKISKLKEDIVATWTKIPKVFIYSLPPKFNKDIVNCIEKSHLTYCMHLQNGGMGKLLYREGEMGVYNTDQFSLEVILHNQLLQSRYRTLSPEEADVFYIPAYMGTIRFCNTSKTVAQLQEELFEVIHSMPYLRQGKPHFSTLARIEREQAAPDYPLLQNRNCKNVTYITIEKDYNKTYRKSLGLENQRVIVAPYPSYVHLYKGKSVPHAISSPGLRSRQVLMFVASGVKQNQFRQRVLDQMSHRVTDVSFEQILDVLKRQEQKMPTGVFLHTLECHGGHTNITIGWMQNSVFCLQPPGDSPTRKSFYDSIQSGCIPVIFRFADQNVEYPFQRVLNYKDFTVAIDSARIERQETIESILKAIPADEIKRLHENVIKVARMLQYSVVESGASDQPHSFKDALDMIMEEVQHMYNI